MNTLIIAPHPDDELLGCGGTLLRRVAEGGTVGWLLMTAIHEQDGWPASRVQTRTAEIERVREGLNIAPKDFFSLGFPTTQLDQIPLATLIERISSVFNTFQPEEVLLPHPGDVHSDHRITFEAAMACTKWFRYPSVRRVLAYETPLGNRFFTRPAHLTVSAQCICGHQPPPGTQTVVITGVRLRTGRIPLSAQCNHPPRLGTTTGCSGGVCSG